MKHFFIILAFLLTGIFNQSWAQLKDRPGIPTVMYTWVLKNGVLVKRSLITCNNNRSYNCFDLVNKDDLPMPVEVPFDNYYNDLDSKLSYIADGISIEEVGKLKHFKGELVGGLSTYTIEMAVNE